MLPRWLRLSCAVPAVLPVIFLLVQSQPDWALTGEHSWRFVRAADGSYAVWRLLASQLVHLSWPHAVGNALAALVLGWVAQRLMPWWISAVALVASALAVAGVLAWDTQCLYYAGASGALHGWLAGGLVWGLLKRSDGTERRLLLLALLGLVAKLSIQQYLPTASGFSGVPVYAPAHWAGVLGGTLAVLLLTRRRPLG